MIFQLVNSFCLFVKYIGIIVALNLFKNGRVMVPGLFKLGFQRHEYNDG